MILGVPDEHEAFDGATTDDEKMTKILYVLGVPKEVAEFRRLGASQNGKKRHILATLPTRISRDAVLENTRVLKTSDERYNCIFIKNNVHPCVRKEWRRLRNVEKSEREKPVNVGCNVRLDRRERNEFVDGVMVDSWSRQGV